jgi:hypothetical protein
MLSIFHSSNAWPRLLKASSLLRTRPNPTTEEAQSEVRQTTATSDQMATPPLALGLKIKPNLNLSFAFAASSLLHLLSIQI